MNTFFDNELKKLWGLHPMQEAFFNSALEENPKLVLARVIFSSHDLCKIRVLGSNHEEWAKIRGNYFQSDKLIPIVGDWVLIEKSTTEHQHIPIEDTLPRKSCLSRPQAANTIQYIASNIDWICLVSSFNKDYNEKRLERGLSMIEASGAKAILVINKSDLMPAQEMDTLIAQTRVRLSNNPDLPIIQCSALNGFGIETLTALFKKGDVVSFLGMSGVGKSTIVNHILKSERLKTLKIRETDDRGRHSTTHREMILTDEGYWLIDSPGIREFSISANPNSLDSTFSDIQELELQCKFSDCRHQTEPLCAIRSALESNTLSLERWQNFQSLNKELKFQMSKENKSLERIKKRQHTKQSYQLRQKLIIKGRRM